MQFLFLFFINYQRLYVGLQASLMKFVGGNCSRGCGRGAAKFQFPDERLISQREELGKADQEETHRRVQAIEGITEALR